MNFEEIIRMNKPLYAKKAYFQPRELLNGQNLCANDFGMFLSSIVPMTEALSSNSE
jgi:hypothetical protein